MEKHGSQFSRPTPWLDAAPFKVEAPALAFVLAAAVAVGDDKLVARELQALLAAKRSVPASFRTAAVRACLAAPDRRQHIHRTLDGCELPVTHTTLRKGSPQVLRLRKKETLFSRHAAYREKLAAIRKELGGDTPAARRSRPRSARSASGSARR